MWYRNRKCPCIAHNHQVCHPERSETKSKDLRTEYLRSSEDNAQILRLRLCSAQDDRLAGAGTIFLLCGHRNDLDW